MNRLSNILILAAIVYAAVVLTLFPRWTVDDAYIYYRYAENLAQSGELNWNVGEDPVEGYTGVAMPVVLAGWMKLGGDPLVASKIIGLAGYALAALMMILCLTRLGVGAIARTAALGFFLTAPIYFTHAWSGLETTWFAEGRVFIGL